MNSNINIDVGRKFFEEAKIIFFNQPNDFIRYTAPNNIPNQLKTNNENRELVIQKIERGRPYMVNRQQIRKNPVAIYICQGKVNIVSQEKKTITRECWPYDEGTMYMISIEEMERNIITVESKFRTALIVCEMFKTESSTCHDLKPIEKYEKQIFADDVRQRRSILKNKFTDDEIKRRILFMDAEFAISVHKSFIPVSVTILDYEGREVMNTLCCPREKIRNYETRCHGLTEKDLIGKPDSDEVIKKIQQLVRNKILIGSDLNMEIKSLRITTDHLAGIRDLANAEVIRDKLKSNHQFMKLSDMANKITGKTIQQGIHTSFEDTNAVRNIYLAMEKEWKDHKNIKVTQEWIMSDEETDEENIVHFHAPSNIDEEFNDDGNGLEKLKNVKAMNSMMMKNSDVDNKINEEKDSEIPKNKMRKIDVAMQVENKKSENKEMQTEIEKDDITGPIILQLTSPTTLYIYGKNVKIEFGK